MSRPALARDQRGGTALVGAALVVVAWAVLASGASVVETLAHGNAPWVFVAAIAAGELARFIMPSGRIVAPLSTASAVGLVLMDVVDSEPSLNLSSGSIVLLVGLGILGGGLLQRALGAAALWAPKAARLLAVAAVAALVRWDPFENFGEGPAPIGTSWPTALAMVVLSSLAVLLEIVLARAAQDSARHSSRDVLGAQLREAPALTVGLATSGPLIALLAPVLGLAAIPTALFPLALSYVSVRRYLATRETYRETITTLSRLTELSGMTPERHAARVAQLSVAMAQHLPLREREIEQLELAALLHDVGQVGLTHAIPGGATVLAAPDDQRHIAAEGARIVRRTAVLDTVADYLEHQATPYRQVRELGEIVPFASRIIKVANAFDDFSEGRNGQRDQALERIHLGLGYEYDPEVVEALIRVVGWANPADDS